MENSARQLVPGMIFEAKRVFHVSSVVNPMATSAQYYGDFFVDIGVVFFLVSVFKVKDDERENLFDVLLLINGTYYHRSVSTRCQNYVDNFFRWVNVLGAI